MQETAGVMFYYRLSSALEAQDLATLETLYHPDATLISLTTGQIIQGRAAIMATITQTLAVTSPIKPIAIESFVELSDIIGVEATQSTRFTQNRQTYDIYILGLTDFYGGDKLGREHATGGHHAKGSASLHEGMQVGSRSTRAKERKSPGTHCTRPGDS